MNQDQSQDNESMRQRLSLLKRRDPESSSSKSEHSQLENMNKEQPVLKKTYIEWHCKGCDRTCIHVREECRCLCGHRLKDHAQGSGNVGWKCNKPKCPCRRFFYIVAEGAWILRCRCKHKHIEHDCSKRPYKCKKPNCKQCNGFESPWVCNCDHPWAMHELRFIEREVPRMMQLSDMLEGLSDVGNPLVERRGQV